MSRAYRVGIVGCGGMGRSHARTWTSKEKTDVVAVMDVNAESARQLGEEFGADV